MQTENAIDDKTQSSNHQQSSNGIHPSSEPLPAGIRESNAGLLSLKDIEAQIGDGSDGFYGRLRRFADVPGIGELLGAVNVPGAKGVRYEPRSAEIFRRLLAAATAKEVTPATAVAWLKLNQDVKLNQDGQPGKDSATAIAEKTQPGNGTELGFATRLLSGVLTPLTAVLGDLAGAIRDLKAGYPAAAPLPLPAPAFQVASAAPVEDRLLTAEQAAELLACHPRTVSRYVAPVRPRTWRYSDCLRYIERVGKKLEEAQKEAAK